MLAHVHRLSSTAKLGIPGPEIYLPYMSPLSRFHGLAMVLIETSLSRRKMLQVVEMPARLRFARFVP